MLSDSEELLAEGIVVSVTLLGISATEFRSKRSFADHGSHLELFLFVCCSFDF